MAAFVASSVDDVDCSSYCGAPMLAGKLPGVPGGSGRRERIARRACPLALQWGAGRLA